MEAIVVFGLASLAPTIVSQVSPIGGEFFKVA
jgi:hypothetical protein